MSLTCADRLIVLARHAEPGKAKTRLIPALGAEGAAALHREMVAHTLRRLGPLAGDLGADGLTIEIRVTGLPLEEARAWLGESWRITDQGPGELGERLARATSDAFAERPAGAARVVVVGTDCPALTAEHVRQAFASLAASATSVVLGPARDGGYYLIGLARPAPWLFQNIDWGTDRVRRQTLERATAHAQPVTELEVLADVDRPEDVEVWERETGR